MYNRQPDKEKGYADHHGAVSADETDLPAHQGGREAADQQRREELLTAKSAAGEQLTGARTDAEGEIERARGEIARELASARASLRAEADDLAREATSRILGRNIS